MATRGGDHAGAAVVLPPRGWLLEIQELGALANSGCGRALMEDDGSRQERTG